jgi:hypothetical protein
LLILRSDCCLPITVYSARNQDVSPIFIGRDSNLYIVGDGGSEPVWITGGPVLDQRCSLSSRIYGRARPD